LPKGEKEFSESSINYFKDDQTFFSSQFSKEIPAKNSQSSVPKFPYAEEKRKQNIL
jgi:hypothetical protein